MKRKSLIIIFSLIIMTSCNQTKIEEFEITTPMTIKDEIVEKESSNKEIVEFELLEPKIEILTPTEFDSIKKDHVIKNFTDDSIFTIKEGNELLLYKDNDLVSEYYYYISYAPDIVVGNKYFSLVGLFDENNVMNMELIVYDLNDKTIKTVYSAPLTNYRNYLYQLNEEEVMFSYNGVKGGNRCEIVVVYNFVKDECRVVLEHDEIDWNDLENTTQEICATFAKDNNIYLIKEQRVNNEIAYELNCLDSYGNLIFEHSIDYLKKYTAEQSNIDYIEVHGDYLFIDYLNTMGARKSFSIAHKNEDDNYVELKLGGKSLPETKASNGLINNRYLVYNTSVDDLDFEAKEYSSNLLIFDLEKGEYRLFKYNIDNVDENSKLYTYVDENGNLIIQYTDYEVLERYYYFVPFEDWV